MLISCTSVSSRDKEPQALTKDTKRNILKNNVMLNVYLNTKGGKIDESGNRV